MQRHASACDDAGPRTVIFGWGVQIGSKIIVSTGITAKNDESENKYNRMFGCRGGGFHFSDVLAKCCERFEVFCRNLGHAALDEDAAKGQTKDDDVNCNKSGNTTLRRRR